MSSSSSAAPATVPLDDALLQYRVPGYMGYVPAHEAFAVGRKVGYQADLAERALQTDADYAESAKRRHSHGVQMSSYTQQVGNAVQPSDFQRPVLVKAAQVKLATAGSTSHWSTTYSAAFGDFESRTGPAPPRYGDGTGSAAARPSQVLNHSMPSSSYATDFVDPGVIMATRPPGQMPVRHDELSFGTNKNSNRLLGYMGFVPAAKANQGQTHATIPTPKNELLTLNFRQNCTGYTGHVPRSPANNRGPRQAGPLTSSGSQFGNGARC